jgi:hypothetical protein
MFAALSLPKGYRRMPATYQSPTVIATKFSVFAGQFKPKWMA